MRDERTPIERAGDAVGGLSKLAALLNLRIQVVSNWRTRGVPIEWCVAIEQATKGAITRRDLRTDWRDIWPELVKPKKAVAQLQQQPAARDAFIKPEDDKPIDNTSK